MKRIFLIRHANADHGPQYTSDFERPLDARGREEAQKMAAVLLSILPEPGFFNISAARRAADTARYFIAAYGATDEEQIQFETQLYLPSVAGLQKIIRSTPARYDSLLLFSHNMALEDYVRQYRPDIRMTPCSIAELRHPEDSWERIDASVTEFQNHFHPEMYEL